MVFFDYTLIHSFAFNKTLSTLQFTTFPLPSSFTHITHPPFSILFFPFFFLFSDRLLHFFLLDFVEIHKHSQPLVFFLFNYLHECLSVYFSLFNIYLFIEVSSYFSFEFVHIYLFISSERSHKQSQSVPISLSIYLFLSRSCLFRNIFSEKTCLLSTGS